MFRRIQYHAPSNTTTSHTPRSPPPSCRYPIFPFSNRCFIKDWTTMQPTEKLRLTPRTDSYATTLNGRTV